MPGSLRQLLQSRPHLLDQPARTRVEKPIRRHQILAVDADAQLTQPAPHLFHVKFRIAPKRSRHPGGYGYLDGSDRTVMNRDCLHGTSYGFRYRSNHPSSRVQVSMRCARSAKPCFSRGKRTYSAGTPFHFSAA